MGDEGPRRQRRGSSGRTGIAAGWRIGASSFDKVAGWIRRHIGRRLSLFAVADKRCGRDSGRVGRALQAATHIRLGQILSRGPRDAQRHQQGAKDGGKTSPPKQPGRSKFLTSRAWRCGHRATSAMNDSCFRQPGDLDRFLPADWQPVGVATGWQTRSTQARPMALRPLLTEGLPLSFQPSQRHFHKCRVQSAGPCGALADSPMPMHPDTTEGARRIRKDG